MTTSTPAVNVKKVNWSAVRDRVMLLNPELAAALDTIKQELPFYLATYAFGATVDDKGEFFLPLDDGTTVSIENPIIPAKLRDDLSYSTSIPVGLVLTQSIELYLQREEQHLPWALMLPGRVFALWRALDGEIAKSYHSHHAWHIKAGMQHAFMLPKISIASAYSKLAKNRGLRAKSPPRDLFDHFALFKDMSRHEQFSQPWQTDVLFFSKAWFEDLSQFHHLELHFYKKITVDAKFWRNKMVYDFMWDSFIAELKKESMFVKSYILDIVKHIVMVALGALPSFTPAMDDTSAPIQGIQRDFLDIYGIKAAPVIMIPTHFDMYDPNTKPVYWSLQFPCYLESVPNAKTRGSHLDDLDQIANLLAYLSEMVEHKRLAVIINTPIEYCLKRVKFEFFHSDAQPDDPFIRPSREMPLEDPRLVHCIVPGREQEVFEFSEVSPFVRGCVRFSLR